MTSQQPLPPNVSPSSQQFFSSPGTNVSYPNAAPVNPYQGGYQPPVSTGGVYGEGYQPQMQQYSQYNQRKPQNYRKGPPSHSSLGSSSSSSREYTPVRPQYIQQAGYSDTSSYEVPQQHHHASYGQHVNRPLSGVMETENDEEDAAAEEEYYHKQPQNAENEPLTVTAARVNNGKEGKVVSPTGHFPEVDSSDMSTSSMKATSCDSGLPPEDVENHMVDPKTPLMGRGQPRNLSRTPVRVSTPRKFV
uniref:Inactive tyrosine-protein kinase transmembrane receptor ROR1 n=1 Tax=Phallusia mammillata TaxID=59560 RepID=A0A6F9DR62_9ASCI|nr:inactive tyrosine-protein kinase transmembrane receptor ROR1 [Phallusia mammillata]